MLGSHSKAVHLGELKNLVKEDGGCHICQPPEACELFHDIKDIPAHDLYETIFSRVPEGIEILIDNSKKPKWFEQFIHDDRYDIRLIHLIRDPRALARRWLMRFEEKKIAGREKFKQIWRNPLSLFRLLFSDVLDVAIYKWYSQNSKIADFIEKSKKPYKIVSYRNIALKPDRTLAELCSWLDISYEPAQKEYWNFSHHGTEKYQYKWVGTQQANNSYFDLRWKSYLSEEQMTFVENHHLVHKLLNRLGLQLHDDGLDNVSKDSKKN